MFYFDNFKGYKILRSDLLDKSLGVDAFFTTRGVNISSLVESSMKLTSGEKQNLSRISDVQAEFLHRNSALYTDEDFANRFITPVQTHSDHVEIVDSRVEYPDTDGLILTEPNTVIYLRFADCTPLIFYDKGNKIGAISHAGWRGTAQKIGVKTIEKMAVNFGTKLENIIALIGPAISICCYEVSEEVRDTLLSTVKNSDELYKERNVDLKKINAQQLKEYGIGVNNIDICPYCTSCNNDLFYSYRKENGTKERHFAMLKISS